MKILLLIFFFINFSWVKSEVNNYSHGIAMHGDLKYKENF